MYKFVRLIEAIITAGDFLTRLLRNGPYLKIKGSAPVSYKGRDGMLVWDCGLWHDITFEDNATKEKYCVENLMSEEEAEKLFNALVEKYGA